MVGIENVRSNVRFFGLNVRFFSSNVRFFGLNVRFFPKFVRRYFLEYSFKISFYFLFFVFYRNGFIENWGQGIQKICDECRSLGADLPVYELTGIALRVHFEALQSALIDQFKAPKHQSANLSGTLDGALALKIINNSYKKVSFFRLFLSFT